MFTGEQRDSLSNVMNYPCINKKITAHFDPLYVTLSRALAGEDQHGISLATSQQLD
jgi:hypothetical protein